MTRKSAAFSLVEVIVAVGVFVAGVVTAVALLSQTTSSARERLERAAASRVAQSVAVLLNTEPWDSIVARSASGDLWYADRGGRRIDLIDTVAANERFFEIRLRRYKDLSSPGSETDAAYFATIVEVRWPAAGEAGGGISPEDRDLLRHRTVVLR